VESNESSFKKIVHHLAMVASAPLTASKREGVSPFMGLIWTH